MSSSSSLLSGTVFAPALLGLLLFAGVLFESTEAAVLLEPGSVLELGGVPGLELESWVVPGLELEPGGVPGLELEWIRIGIRRCPWISV